MLNLLIFELKGMVNSMCSMCEDHDEYNNTMVHLIKEKMDEITEEIKKEHA